MPVADPAPVQTPPPLTDPASFIKVRRLDPLLGWASLGRSGNLCRAYGKIRGEPCRFQ
jgi:hypothetical protein